MISKEDITRIGQQAGLPAFYHAELILKSDWVNIERFAKLLLSEECEACAQIADISEPYQSADKIRERKKMYETVQPT